MKLEQGLGLGAVAFAWYKAYEAHRASNASDVAIAGPNATAAPASVLASTRELGYKAAQDRIIWAGVGVVGVAALALMWRRF